MQDLSNIYFAPQRNEVITVLLTGLISAGLSVIAAWAIATYLIGPVICGGSTSGLCAEPFALSYNIFIILGALISVGLFARAGIFRPALIALPASIMFWSLPIVFAGLLSEGLLTFGLISTLLISFSYLVFYWLVRIRNFLVVLILWISFVLLMRFMIVI